jgi:hypothetical protein
MIDIAQKTFPKSIEIRGMFTDDLQSIVSDPTQLHQVLLNLCVNARDAMPQGGSLTLSAENFEVDENYTFVAADASPGRYVMLSVSDTGTGMPRAMIDRIFDPFFTTKEIGRGTGLGLSTSLGIVKSHGGFISVYSQQGSGTTFKIFLPAEARDDPFEDRGAPKKLPKGNGELILLVDDEPSILEVATRILEKHNYRVIVAHNGTEALDIFAAEMNRISGVITDVTMPYMDGVALVRAIRKMKPDVPFIASTGHGEETGLSELRELSVTHFLTKPYGVAGLLEAVGEFLQAPQSE